MRKIMITLMVALFSFGITMQAADAARFGGGSSIGKMSRSISKGPSYSSAGSRTATSPGMAGARSGLSRFMGPLAGMLAGGLLASMLFGGHFSAPGLLDMLLIAAVIFFAVRFFKRRNQTATADQRSSQQDHTTSQPYQHEQRNATSTSASQAPAGGAQANGAQGSEYDMPSDFNRDAFLQEMHHRFLRLQKAWDANDMAQIQDNVTPEFYNVLNNERRQQPEQNVTEVVRLFVEMGHVATIGNQHEATVLFHGIIREQGQEQEFNETWHMICDSQTGKTWYLQGIEQNG